MAALWSSVRNTKGDVAGRSQMGGEADSRSQWNARYGADSGPSRADTCRCSVRPTEAFKAAVCFVRFTSTPAMRLTPRRKLTRIELLIVIVQVTARQKSGGVVLRHPPQPRGAPITAALASFSRGISSRMSSRISVASGHPGPEHSTSTWRRSSFASGHRIRLVTSPPSTRKTICPKNESRRVGLTLRRIHRAAGTSVWRKRAERGRSRCQR
jgi:hypothetical protein